jgi:hypothetical protein
VIDRKPVDAGDPVRTVLAFVAAVVALLATVAVLSDRTHGLTYADSLLDERVILPLAAVAVGTLWLYSRSHGWPRSSRIAAAVIAILWAAAGLGALPRAMTMSCCSLGVDHDVRQAVVSPFGIGTTAWIVIAVTIGPLLLLLAATPVPDRPNGHSRPGG